MVHMMAAVLLAEGIRSVNSNNQWYNTITAIYLFLHASLFAADLQEGCCVKRVV